MTEQIEKHTGQSRWFYGWNIVGVGLTSQMLVVGLSTGCFSMFVLPLEEELQATRLSITLIYSFLFIGMVVFAPTVQFLVKKTSLRVCMIIGAVCLSTGLLLLSFASNVVQVIVIYAILIAMGTTFGGAIPCSTLVVNWFTRLRGRAMGMSTVGASLGGFLMPPVAAYLIDFSGWRTTYLLFAVFSAVILLPVIWFVIADKPEDIGLRPDGDTESPPDKVDQKPSSATLSVSDILKNRAYWLIALTVGIGTMIYKGILVNLVPIAIERGVTSIQSAYLISAMTACMIVGKILIGSASDRISSHTMLFIALFLSAAGVITLVLPDNIYGLIIGSVLLGIGTGGYFPLIGMVIGENFPRLMFAKVMGLIMPAIYVFTVPGAPIAGYIYDNTGSYVPALWIFFVVLLVTSVLPLFAKKKSA